MRLRLIVSFVLLAVPVVPLQAQKIDLPAESASPALIADALQAMDLLVLQEKETYNFELKNRPVSLTRLDKGQRLLVKAYVKKPYSLETLNRYNEQVAVTTRAVRYQKIGVFLEAGVDCQLGITSGSLQKFLARFAGELAKFDVFVARQTENKLVEDKVTGKKKVPLDVLPGSDDKEFVITFPTQDTENWETAWKITWDVEARLIVKSPPPKNGKKIIPRRDNRLVFFKIKKAYFKPGQKAEWIQVIEDAHPSEFYVPYYFKDTRFYDLRDVGAYVPLSPREGGPISQTLSKARNVMAELRDAGVAYKHGNITRRRQELTLWANFGAANYTYMVEYGFQDDGTIVFRHAPTGYNYFSHLDASHMHGSYWRVGIKLGPEGNNTVNQVYTTRLPLTPKDQGNKGQMQVEEITREGYVDWSPREFTRVRITNPFCSLVPASKNGPALPISYDLVTQPQGIARHERFKDEKFSLHDFWITRHDCPEKMYVNLGGYFFTPNGQANLNVLPLDRQNVVLWHSSSALHVPRAEDGIIGGNNVNNGQAMIYWTTFELRPRNLFAKTPIYRSLSE